MINKHPSFGDLISVNEKRALCLGDSFDNGEMIIVYVLCEEGLATLEFWRDLKTDSVDYSENINLDILSHDNISNFRFSIRGKFEIICRFEDI